MQICVCAVKVDLYNLTKKYALNAVCMCALCVIMLDGPGGRPIKSLL